MQLMVRVTVLELVFVCVCDSVCVCGSVCNVRDQDSKIYRSNRAVRSLLSEQTLPCVLKRGDLHSQTFIYMYTW